jgi:nanoRNase/pAp phosphatase (c-di-AMP/oligoRNAs hydrolase)
VPLANESQASVVATAMFFGLQTDTDDFALGSSADFHAAAYLKPFTDSESLSRLGRRNLAAESMDAVGRALRDLEVIRDFALSGVGRVSALNRDAIAIAADFILRREDIDTVLVYGIVEDRIDGSFRTNRASEDPAAFMLTAFGEDENGRPYGGGRSDKGGFQIPLGVLADCDDDETLWRLVKQVVHRHVAKVVPEVAKLARVKHDQ